MCLQLQLEEEAAQSAEQPPKAKSPPPQQKPKSLVQKIYEENRVITLADVLYVIQLGNTRL